MATTDAALAGIAAGQHGLVTREAARRVGVPLRALRRRIEAGVLAEL